MTRKQLIKEKKSIKIYWKKFNKDYRNFYQMPFKNNFMFDCNKVIIEDINHKLFQKRVTKKILKNNKKYDYKLYDFIYNLISSEVKKYDV